MARRFNPPADSSMPSSLTFDTSDLTNLNSQECPSLTNIAACLGDTLLDTEALHTAGFDATKLRTSIINKFVERKLVDENDEGAMRDLCQMITIYLEKSEKATQHQNDCDSLGGSQHQPLQSRSFLSVGNFTFIRELRQGGFARIFHVASSQRHFAIKCVLLNGEQNKRDDQLAIAKREAALLRELHHENIVRCFDAFDARFRNSVDAFCIQLELCGASLKDFLAERNRQLTARMGSGSGVMNEGLEPVSLPGVPKRCACSFDEQFSRTLLQQLLAALSYLHDRVRLAHGDITPANVLFELAERQCVADESVEAFNIRLCDFGLSTKLDNADAYELCGTPLYHAPELVELSYAAERHRDLLSYRNGSSADGGNFKVDLAKADVYSVGVIAYEMGATFATELERSRCICNVKMDPRFCEVTTQSRFAFDPRASPVYQLICAALARDATDRLTAQQLLHLLD